MKRNALGRGLKALIPEEPEDRPQEAVAPGYREIDIDLIAPNPRQPRKSFDSNDLQSLARSVAEQGVITPIVVRPSGDRYELVAGERRWRAAQMAGLRRVPALVRDLADAKSLEVALVENIQRQELNAIEEAEAYRVLSEDFHVTQEEIATRVGKDRSTIANTLRLLKLPDAVRQLVADGKLSAGQARALLALPDTRAVADAAARVIASGLNVRQVEALVKRQMTHRVKTRPLGPAAEDVFVKSAAERLQQKLQTKVSIESSGPGGRICIQYHSAEELTRLFDRLMKA
ncbi:MAG: ParB/RepB/Spo0J family partition protein [Acidobacteriota bacterium]